MAGGVTTTRTAGRLGGGGLRRNGYGGGGRPAGRSLPPDTWRLGMLFALAGISMLFVGLTSAYIVRQGLGEDWRSMGMPPLMWVNTAFLLASSFAMEKARRGMSRRWLWVAFSLGVAFVLGQLAAWRQLTAQGIYLSTNPHNSFFYLLSGLHGLHVMGGMAALGWVALRLRRTRIEAAALYWHFMDGLWVYLLILLFGRG